MILMIGLVAIKWAPALKNSPPSGTSNKALRDKCTNKKATRKSPDKLISNFLPIDEQNKPLINCTFSLMKLFDLRNFYKTLQM